MQNFLALNPDAARGKTVALITSHLSAEGDEADYTKNHALLSVIQQEGFGKVIIIPTGMLNIHLLQNKPGLALPSDRMSAAFDLTLHFLQAILPALAQLTIPFEILSFDYLKYNGIPELVFTPNVDTDFFAQLALWEKTAKENIKQDGVTQKISFQKSSTEVERRCQENRNQLGDDIKGTAKRKPRKTTKGQAGLKQEDSLKYVKDECAFNFELSLLNALELEKTGQKKIDFLLYSGGLLNRALMNVEINMISEANRLGLIAYDEESQILKQIPLRKDACAGNMKGQKAQKVVGKLQGSGLFTPMRRKLSSQTVHEHRLEPPAEIARTKGGNNIPPLYLSRSSDSSAQGSSIEESAGGSLPGSLTREGAALIEAEEQDTDDQSSASAANSAASIETTDAANYSRDYSALPRVFPEPAGTVQDQVAESEKKINEENKSKQEKQEQLQKISRSPSFYLDNDERSVFMNEQRADSPQPASLPISRSNSDLASSQQNREALTGSTGGEELKARPSSQEQQETKALLDSITAALLKTKGGRPFEVTVKTPSTTVTVAVKYASEESRSTAKQSPNPGK